jgi:FkbM family methyltransferase
MRALAWRLGRLLSRWARREGDNDPRSNGEHWLLDQMAAAAGCEAPVLVDGGARLGDWSAAALRALRHHGRGGHIHACEPVRATFEHLAHRFAGERSVTVHPIALSDRSGPSRMFVPALLSGTSSLHPIAGAAVEPARLASLDELFAEAGIGRVAIVKTDTEGHDLTVLRGAQQALGAGRIDVWQFEYNHRWLANGASLMSVFELIEHLPYRFGKLYGNGIELYEEWHFELDRFVETNCVLVRVGGPYEGLGRPMRFDGRNVARQVRR